MNLELLRIIPQPKTVGELVHSFGDGLGFSVQDFWRWSASDLLSNATRGRFAEFVVATALGVPVSGVRDEWSAYDLLTPEGIPTLMKLSGGAVAYNDLGQSVRVAAGSG